MENEISQILVDRLNKLIHRIKIIIEDGVAKKVFQPENELYFRWKVKGFKYGDKGIESSSAEGEFLTKKSWFRTTYKILEMIQKSIEYKTTLDFLTPTFPQNKKINNDFNAFIKEIIHNKFSTKEERAEMKTIIQRFIADFSEKPIKYGAEIQLQGIALRQAKIEPSFGILIRQPVRDDLEKEVPYHGPFLREPFLSNPSAIAKLEFMGRDVSNIQIRVAKLMAMLRLFKVCSVKYLSYRMYSESITDVMAKGILSGGGQEVSAEIGIITQEDEPKLKSFWQILDPILPQSLYWFGEEETNHINLAYNYYSDALMHHGTMEKRIANAVMGLEALLLDSPQELSFRLGLRIAKIMSLFGKNPKEAREIIKDAYRIRSLFAHGNRLTYREKRKLESKYKDIKNILLSVMDYLRRMTVMMITIHKTKEEFIDLTDDSFIDKESENNLNNLLSLAKQVLI